MKTRQSHCPTQPKRVPRCRHATGALPGSATDGGDGRRRVLRLGLGEVAGGCFLESLDYK
jgi:hypothetical protein